MRGVADPGEPVIPVRCRQPNLGNEVVGAATGAPEGA
jgi:hypothetical protein